jgi:hypothetical protein
MDAKRMRLRNACFLDIGILLKLAMQRDDTYESMICGEQLVILLVAEEQLFSAE